MSSRTSDPSSGCREKSSPIQSDPWQRGRKPRVIATGLTPSLSASSRASAAILIGHTPNSSPSHLGTPASVILDIGTYFTRLGFSGESSPRCIVPHRVRSLVPTIDTPEGIVVASRSTELLSLLSPSLYDARIRRTTTSGHLEVTNERRNEHRMQLERRLEGILKHAIYTECCMDVKGKRAVLLESRVFADRDLRRAIESVLLCRLRATKVSWIPAHVCSILTTGSDAGLVIDMGGPECSVVPVYDCRPLVPYATTVSVGGKALLKRLREMCVWFCSLVVKPLEKHVNYAVADPGERGKGDGSHCKGRRHTQEAVEPFLHLFDDSSPENTIKGFALSAGIAESEPSRVYTSIDWTLPLAVEILHQDFLQDIILKAVFISSPPNLKSSREVEGGISGASQEVVTTGRLVSMYRRDLGGVEGVYVPVSVGRGMKLFVPGWVRACVGEVLFDGDEDGESVVTAILESLKRADIDLRAPLASRMLLTGGLACLPGMRRRILAELKQCLEGDTKRWRSLSGLKERLRLVRTGSGWISPNVAAWTGASIAGALDLIPATASPPTPPSPEARGSHTRPENPKPYMELEDAG